MLVMYEHAAWSQPVSIQNYASSSDNIRIFAQRDTRVEKNEKFPAICVIKLI